MIARLRCLGRLASAGQRVVRLESCSVADSCRKTGNPFCKICSGRRPADEDGFTTVEVLVAFGIAAAATVMAFQIAGTAAGAVRRIEASRVAADEAEGVVLRRLAEGPLRPGLTQGAFSDGTPWTLAIADLRPALGLARVPPLWQVRVSRAGTAAPLYATLIPGKSSETPAEKRE